MCQLNFDWILNRIPPEGRPELQSADKSLRLEVADGNLLSIEGVVSLEFKDFT